MSSQLQVSGEAKIRDIQGPVVANSGVITALDGAASQYVRGDGTLADFPTSSGGGSSVSYYLNSSVSQGTIGGVAYRELSKEPIIGAGTDIAISANGYVASYITDVNDPDVILIPGGNFNLELYFSVSNDTGNPYTYAELYKYDGTTFTLLGSSVGVPEYITQGTVINPYYFAIPVATATLALTDRLAIRIYVNVDGRTVTLHTENSHLCQVVTTLSKGMVSLNNLTDQSQNLTTGTSGTNFAIVSSGDTHTFNLPIASATNTGKLSSTDWSTFNNKQAALSFTAPLNNTSNTISIPAATSLVDGYLDNLDWVKFDTAYNRSLTSAAVTGTTTKTLTLNKQDGGTITASWTDDNTDAVTSVFGRTGAVVATSGDYNTSQVTELTNLYFTDARSRAALSFTAGSGAYNSTTGVITIPTNTNQLTNGASFITLASLSGGTGITYNNTTGVITNSAPDQTVSLTQGAGISISGTYPSFTIASTITQYTDALARAALSFTAGSGAYNSTTGVITIPTNNNQITNGSNFITLTSLSAGAGINYNNTTGAISSTITQYTDALARAAISLTTTGTSGAATYNSTTGVFNIPQYTDQYVGTVTSVGLSSSTSGVTIGSSPITTSGTITLAIATASGSQNGLLSSTDWTTFNNKYNLPSLTSGSVLFSNGSTIAQDNANFFWDDTNNRLGIGTATPSFSLDVVKAGANAIRAYNSDSGSVDAYFIAQNTTTAALFGTNNAGPYLYTASALDMQFYTSAIERMRIFSDGNILIGNAATNAGYKLDVSGTGRFTGALSTTGGTRNIQMVSFAADWNYLRSNGANLVFGTQDANTLYIRTNDVDRLTIASTGAATFSSSIAATSATFSGILSSSGGDIRSAGTAADSVTAGPFISVRNASNAYQYLLQLNATYGLDFWTFGGTWNKRMTLDASGNLGLGVTPSAWFTSAKVIQVLGAALEGRTTVTQLWCNGYVDAGASGNFYQYTGFASKYTQVNSEHQWFTAPSGTAGNAISFTQAMTLTAAGNLLVGNITETAGYKLQVNGLGRFINTNTILNFGELDANNIYFQGLNLAGDASKGFVWYGTGEYMRIFSDGNIGINTGNTNANYKLDVNGTGRFSGDLTIAASSQLYLTSGDLRYSSNAGFGIVSQNGTRLVTIQNGAFGVTGAATFSSSVTATSFFESSDSRLKILVKDYQQPKGIENVAARMYIKNSKQELGYYAQDLQEILPSAVSEGEDGFLNLSYSQVHTAKIAYLENKVAQLEELIKSLL